jgi:signal transduction histidine kinase
MASKYDESIASLTRVNDLLRQALNQVQALLEQLEPKARETGQDNHLDEASPASPPSA